MPRIAGLLLERAREDSVEDLTHQEIAQHLRVYRESVTAALGELRKAGIMGTGRKRIPILNRLDWNEAHASKDLATSVQQSQSEFCHVPRAFCAEIEPDDTDRSMRSSQRQ